MVDAGNNGSLNDPFTFSSGDLDAFLALKPWEDPKKHRDYLLGIRDQTILQIDTFELSMLALAAVTYTHENADREARLINLQVSM